jgi:glycosyltransferase involved in cell wall biosynthesis
MRILLVHTRYLQAGGEDVAFEAEAQLLEQAGHDVFRFETTNAPLRDMSGVKAAAVSIWNERVRGELRSLARRSEPDVVHFHNTFPYLSPAAYYALQPGAAVVQTLHNYRLICPAAVLFRAGQSCEQCVGHFPWAGIAHGCYRSSRAATAAVGAVVQAHRAAGTWRRVDAYVALSEHARSLFVRGGLPAERVFVKPNFVHPDPGEGRHESDYYLYAGRLEEQKGVLTLLAAWAQLEKAPRLRIVGDGPLRGNVEAAAARHQSIEYAGLQTRTRVLELMAEARALVFPSLSHENCPLSIIEAFATGLPVIASGTGNIASFMRRGDSGWTYTPGEAGALAAAVGRCEANPAERKHKGRDARARWQREFTAAASREQLEAIYASARERVYAA